MMLYPLLNAQFFLGSRATASLLLPTVFSFTPRLFQRYFAAKRFGFTVWGENLADPRSLWRKSVMIDHYVRSATDTEIFEAAAT